MNYQAIYLSLIDRAKNRNLDGYSENHHIIPRCMGGNDASDNLVKLTAREHFIAHLLLVKIYPSNLKLVKAVAMMCVGQQERKLTNRLYGKVRLIFSLAMSESQSGTNNSQFGTMWITNEATNEYAKIKKDDTIPDGWIKGKVNLLLIRERKSKDELVRRKKESERVEKINQYREWYSLYSQMGFDKFKELANYKYSKPNLVQNFAKYLPEFIPQNGKKRS